MPLSRCLLFFLLVLTGGSAFSQGFRAGFRAGMTATQVDGDQLQGFNQAGLLGGITVSRDLGERFSLGMEMIYIQKGSRKPLNTDDNTYYVMRLSYVEVPLLLRFNAGKKLMLEAGPSFGVLVASKEKDQSGIIDYAPPFEKREYSLNAGLGYLLSDDLLFNARYGFSLLPVRRFDSVLNYYYWDRGQFNSVVQLSLNYSF
ncbi:MAG: hypothetical protein RL213_1412 [Bacteroidota bacterium]|jgi:hypothetical protein